MRWDIEALERHERRLPSFFSVVPVAQPGRSPNWSVLEGLAPSRIEPPVDAAVVAAELQRIAERRADPLSAVAASVHLTTLAAPDAELAQAVLGGLEGLRALHFEDGPVFPDASVEFVHCSPALAWRAALARVLMRIEDEPGLLATKPEPAEGELLFTSAWSLQADLVLSRDAYVAPLLLCLTPWVWAVSVGRPQGLVLYELGSAIVGRLREPSELIQVFLPAGAPTSTLRPEIGLAESEATIRWWIKQLNGLFGEIRTREQITFM